MGDLTTYCNKNCDGFSAIEGSIILESYFFTLILSRYKALDHQLSNTRKLHPQCKKTNHNYTSYKSPTTPQTGRDLSKLSVQFVFESTSDDVPTSKLKRGDYEVFNSRLLKDTHPKMKTIAKKKRRADDEESEIT
ncbi:8790_t:CDS:2, partial [Funneliformis mosseae]